MPPTGCSASKGPVWSAWHLIVETPRWFGPGASRCVQGKCLHAAKKTGVAFGVGVSKGWKRETRTCLGLIIIVDTQAGVKRCLVTTGGNWVVESEADAFYSKRREKGTRHALTLLGPMCPSPGGVTLGNLVTLRRTVLLHDLLL